MSRVFLYFFPLNNRLDKIPLHDKNNVSTQVNRLKVEDYKKLGI